MRAAAGGGRQEARYLRRSDRKPEAGSRPWTGTAGARGRGGAPGLRSAGLRSLLAWNRRPCARALRSRGRISACLGEQRLFAEGSAAGGTAAGPAERAAQGRLAGRERESRGCGRRWRWGAARLTPRGLNAPVRRKRTTVTSTSGPRRAVYGLPPPRQRSEQRASGARKPGARLTLRVQRQEE